MIAIIGVKFRLRPRELTNTSCHYPGSPFSTAYSAAAVDDSAPRPYQPAGECVTETQKRDFKWYWDI